MEIRQPLIFVPNRICDVSSDTIQNRRQVGKVHTRAIWSMGTFIVDEEDVLRLMLVRSMSNAFVSKGVC